MRANSVNTLAINSDWRVCEYASNEEEKKKVYNYRVSSGKFQVIADELSVEKVCILSAHRSLYGLLNYRLPTAPLVAVVI